MTAGFVPISPSLTNLLTGRDGKRYISDHNAGEYPPQEPWPSGRGFFVPAIMATSAPHPCGHPGCRALIKGARYCSDHSRQAAQEEDQRRGSSAQRGYGYRWQKASKAYLQHHPLCKDCQSRGLIVGATVVDHIIPHRGDWTIFWDSSNWQGLCFRCHNSRKQSIEKKNQHRPG